MTGLVPDPAAGIILVTDALGNSVGTVPSQGLFNNTGTTFTIKGGLSYLQVPTVAGSCGGRITPIQMNAVESELLALASKFNPSFNWDPNLGNNLALAYSPSGAEAELRDIFGNHLGYIQP